MARSDYYNLTQLKERGWTASIVKKLVDIQPTEFKGLYSRQPQKCYPKSYIEGLEQTARFAELKGMAETRQAAMQAVADAKRATNIAKFTEQAESVKIPVLSEEELKKRTIKSKRRWYSRQAEIRCTVDDGIDEDGLPAVVLHRWEVNFVRHELTGYERLLERIAGLVGTRDIYHVVKCKILDKISEAYPWLADECSRQKES